MAGTVDGENTFTYPNNKAFEPMVSLKITNNSAFTAQGPRVLFNKVKNWFDIQTLTEECFKGAVTEKEKALSLWKFMRDNRLHYNEPQCCDEINDPIKMLGTYGYGVCFNTNYANTRIAQNIGAPYRAYSPRGGRHFVSEMNFGAGYVLIDSDMETFYLKADNSTIAGFNDIITDQNLIRRVHHYGKGEMYNRSNSFLASSIYITPPTYSNWGGLRKFHSLDFSLRPGESIVYDWQPGAQYHSYGSVHSALSSDIANGQFIYNTNFLSAELKELLDAYQNITITTSDGSAPNLHCSRMGSNANFVLKIASPFVILNGVIKGTFVRKTEADEIKILFSKDSITWEPIWVADQIGTFVDSVDLSDKIATTSSGALYSYLLKFEITPSDGVTSCGMDSLQVYTDFQISRFFLPSLKLGENIIDYSDSNSPERNIDVEITWRESSENAPPSQVTSPVFPADNAQVDSLRFMFKWEPVADDDIIDYEFMLSDRPDMLYPLTPSFEVYTSRVNENGDSAFFSVPFDGMLNSGTTYYWKVRAKDTRGAWGLWSPVWSFTPVGTMPPLNVISTINGQTITIGWDKNALGLTPAYYEVHASRERLGFTPDEHTLIDTTRSTQLVLPFDDERTNIFYRVIAIDLNGKGSGPSNVASLPYPFLYTKVDTLKPGGDFTLNLLPTRFQTRDMLQSFSDTYFTVILDDIIDVEILSMPENWNFAPESGLLSGKITYPEIHRYYTTDTTSLVKIKLTSRDGDLTNIQSIKIPLQNSLPLLASSIDTTAYINTDYHQMIKCMDPDSAFGDFITRAEILSKPSWLRVDFDIEGQHIVLQGSTPAHAKDTVVALKIYDAANSSIAKSYKIAVRRGMGIAGDTTICPGDSVRLQFTFTGNGPWSVTYYDGADTTEIDSIATSPYYLYVTPVSASRYSLISASAADSIPQIPVDSLVVVQMNAPVILGMTNDFAIRDVPFKSQILFSSNCDPVFRLLGSPGWLSIDSLSGTLRGTPARHDIGVSTISISVKTKNSNYHFYQFQLDVRDSQEVQVVAMPNRICRGDSAVINFSFSGTAPWNLQYVENRDTVNIDSIMTSSYSIAVRPLITTEYRFIPIKNDSVRQVLTDSIVSIMVDTFIIQGVTNHSAIEGAEFLASLIVDKCAGGQEYELIEAPDWLTIEKLSGILRGVPGSEAIGTDSVVLKVKDRSGHSLIYRFDLQVKERQTIEVMLTGNAQICTGDSTALEFTFKGKGPWSALYSNGTDTVRIDDIVNSPYHHFVRPLVTTEYFLLPLSMDSARQILVGGGVKIVVKTPVIQGITENQAIEGNLFVTEIVVNDECNSNVSYEITDAPDWLSLDTDTGAIAGIPFKSDIADTVIHVKITDVSGNVVTRSFSIKINPPSETVSEIIQVSPNPFKFRTDIHFKIDYTGLVILDVYTLTGKKITNLINEERNKGQYKVTWEPASGTSGSYIILLDVIGKDVPQKRVATRVIQFE